MAQKRTILKAHPTSVDHKSELDFVNTFEIMVRNQHFEPFSVIFWPLEGQNWPNVAQKLFSSEHSPSKCIHQI